jgi:hypothetical protein
MQLVFADFARLTLKIAREKRREHLVVGTIVRRIEILYRLTDPCSQPHISTQLFPRFTHSGILGRFVRQGAAPGQKSPGLRYNNRYILLVFDHDVSGRAIGVRGARLALAEYYRIAHTFILDRPGLDPLTIHLKKKRRKTNLSPTRGNKTEARIISA